MRQMTISKRQAEIIKFKMDVFANLFGTPKRKIEKVEIHDCKENSKTVEIPGTDETYTICDICGEEK